MVLLIGLIAGIGFAMLYSAAGGSFDPWADRQMIRFVVGIMLMLGRGHGRYSRLAEVRVSRSISSRWCCSIGVEIAGDIGMGAQRWIDLGVFQLQPSELMKVALVLALARYFHGLERRDRRAIRYAGRRRH